MSRPVRLSAVRIVALVGFVVATLLAAVIIAREPADDAAHAATHHVAHALSQLPGDAFSLFRFSVALFLVIVIPATAEELLRALLQRVALHAALDHVRELRGVRALVDPQPLDTFGIAEVRIHAGDD